eukprot:TRINITY_DN70494_c0_g1_i1.p1 TRINITY_DN70494_c0_g1~~TRINITY_DN70494_c0_g1_i1.p1  ORF type:complete len:248 (+),score=5.60 TRINITY_DN70494_c0_g1_i1:52-795(+)
MSRRTYGSIARAGRVKMMTPKVPAAPRKRKKRGRACMRRRANNNIAPRRNQRKSPGKFIAKCCPNRGHQKYIRFRELHMHTKTGNWLTVKEPTGYTIPYNWRAFDCSASSESPRSHHQPNRIKIKRHKQRVQLVGLRLRSLHQLDTTEVFWNIVPDVPTKHRQAKREKKAQVEHEQQLGFADDEQEAVTSWYTHWNSRAKLKRPEKEKHALASRHSCLAGRYCDDYAPVSPTPKETRMIQRWRRRFH